MIAVVTPAEMNAVGRAATVPVDVLVGRAGFAVAREARRMLGGVYGRSVTVIAGPGNNGADGGVAANCCRATARRRRCCAGVRPVRDLVTQAGTGFAAVRSHQTSGPPRARRRHRAASSGLCAWRPGGCCRRRTVMRHGSLLFNDGPWFAGSRDRGLRLDVGPVTSGVIGAADVRLAAWRPLGSHSGRPLRYVVAGSTDDRSNAALLDGAPRGAVVRLSCRCRQRQGGR